MKELLTVAGQVWILFALIGAGAACRWARLLDEAAVKGIVNLLVMVVTPCLIVDVFQRPFDGAMLGQLALAFAVAAVIHMALACATTWCVRGGGEARRPVLRLAIAFSNAGFMGIPLEQAILGERGVFFGIAYVVMFNLFMWSWGIGQMRPRAAGGVRSLEIFVNPGTVGLACGLALFLSRTQLPDALATPVELLASLNTPLAMLAIGFYLAGAKLRAVARSASAYTAGAARLLACPLAVMALLYPCRGFLDRDMMLAIVVASSAPVAAMVAMFAAKYSRDVDLSVGLVSATTLASIFTMPPVIALAMHVLN